MYTGILIKFLPVYKIMRTDKKVLYYALG